MWAIDLPFWLLIGIIAGFLNLIPFLGPVVGGALAALVALLNGDVSQAIWAVLIFTAILLHKIPEGVTIASIMLAMARVRSEVTRRAPTRRAVRWSSDDMLARTESAWVARVRRAMNRVTDGV